MALKPVAYIDLSEETQKWKTARYGREVRAANAAAFEKIQGSVNDTIQNINDTAQQVQDTAEEVQDTRQEAQEAVEHANDITEQYKQYADGKLKETEQERVKAEEARGGAEEAVILAESWAHGGTGQREGENADNAKFWSLQSEGEADRAREEADRASQYAQIVAPGFYLDLETAMLYIKAGVGVDFLLQDAQLYWKITA